MCGIDQVTGRCPYCGEAIDLLVDLSVARQEYVEDCMVCCQPIDVCAEVDPAGTASVSLRRGDE